MKKIIPLFCTISTSLFPIINLTCCSKQEKNVYTQQVIDEFIGNQQQGIDGIVSCPRPGKYYDAIIPYLKNRAKNIVGLSDQDIYIDEAHNIYFDIPATNGYEDKDMIIIQGHTDMIVAGLSEDEAKTKPINPVIDNNTIHSRDYKTSLGADNGIGLAIAFTILRNCDNFVHGPLRFLMTADEDIGMIGAKALNPSWLKINGQPIKWLINIDAEEEGYVYRSCAGNSHYIPKKEFEPSNQQALPYEFTLTLDGLLGGHSAIDIVKQRGNADRFAYEFLYRVVNHESKPSIQIVSHNHEKNVGGEIKEINYTRNQLISNCNLTFKTNLDNTIIQSLWSEALDSWQNEKYCQDNWQQIRQMSSVVLNTSSSDKYLSSEDSNTLIELMGDYTFDPKVNLKSFFYGVVDYIDEEKTIPLSSINLGPVNIKLNENQKIQYTGGASTRSSIGTSTSDEHYSINWLTTKYNSIAQSKEIEVEAGPKYYPWLKDDNNQLVKLLFDGYKTLGVNPTIYDDLGGVEPAIWTEKSGNQITCACVGPRIDNAHSVIETLYVKTIEPCVLNIFQTISQITKTM